MKLSTLLLPSKPFTITILFALSIFTSITSWANTKKSPNASSVVLTELSGNIWVEIDENSTYDGEPGPSGVLIELYNNDEDTLVAQSISTDGKYEFNNVPEGKYYLRIDQSAFVFGGPLFGLQSCPGTNDANDMVDDDDNGSDTTPNAVLCSPFNLVNNDPMLNVAIEYIDFCFSTTCDELNPLALLSCESITAADILCDINGLDGLCATMPTDSSEGNQPMPLCDGINMSENISWFAFAAAAGNYSINIIPLSCTFGTIGQQGLQVGVYTDCSFSETVFCSETCTEQPISIPGSVLNPGQIYYMYINGCNGNVCSYQMDINGSATIASLEPEAVCIFSDGNFQCEDLEYCLGTDIIFQAQGLTLSGEYTWSVTTISGGDYTGDSIVNTTENELVLNVITEGKYNICLTDVSNECVDQSWSGVVCREVTTSMAIPVPADEEFGEFLICEGELEDFTINEFAAEDPNGDGDFGWNAPIPNYMFGENEGIVSVEGCLYNQSFTLTELPPNTPEDVNITICEDDLPLQVDALIITEFSFAGNQTFTLENYLLTNTTDMNGCDSVINLTIEKLNIFAGLISDPICTSDGIILSFDYFVDLSTEIEFLTFDWQDPSGNSIPTGIDPLTVTAPFESGSGEYTLQITIDKNGTSCIYDYSVFVDIALYLPANPIISGPDLVCEGDSAAVYSILVQGDATGFDWSFPNDVVSANISGATGEILTIGWGSSAGGEITAIAQNGCGLSDLSSFDVEVVPMSTPNFSIDTSICIDNPATIDFSGSNLFITDYIWDFDGGTVLSGSGMGPYEVSWDSPGDKFVSLYTIDMNGCQSNTTVNSIPVKFPLEPTQVFCNVELGSITFTWEIPLMVSGFEVNVLSGQTGGIFTANSFTISGLEEEEEVTIELLTMPEDPICGENVSTIISCTSQSCLAPVVELSAEESVCTNGENITIEATIVSGENGTGVFEGDGIIDAVNGIFDPSVAEIGTNTVSFTFTTDLGCAASDNVFIEVLDQPTPSFTQDMDTICILDQLNLEYTGTPNADVYDWDFEDGTGSGLLTNQEVIFSTPGLKNLSLQVTKDDCVSEVFTSSVLVDPEIELPVISCTPGEGSIDFSWNEIAGVSLFEVQIDDDPPFFTPNTSITVDGLGSDQIVELKITPLSNSSCPVMGDSLICTSQTVGVDNELLSDVSIFPNPVQDYIYIEGLEGRKMSFDLFTILGKTMKKGVVTESIDLSQIVPGVYILRVRDDSTQQFVDFKIIK